MLVRNLLTGFINLGVKGNPSCLSEYSPGSLGGSSCGRLAAGERDEETATEAVFTAKGSVVSLGFSLYLQTVSLVWSTR
jgi:hypothetical protein